MNRKKKYIKKDANKGTLGYAKKKKKKIQNEETETKKKMTLPAFQSIARLWRKRAAGRVISRRNSAVPAPTAHTHNTFYSCKKIYRYVRSFIRHRG